ncbi:MAG TPA: DUF2164 domain-containing protein [Gemmatimonadaceae bacterium]|nr:DUF2164 domain-containing protein [Gemmatimonadaceae bacterium]
MTNGIFELSDDIIDKMLSSIKRYFKEQREEEIGDLQAKLLLDFVLAEIGPSIYNTAITDAQVYLRERVADLDGACFKPEFGYWPKGATRRSSSR